MGKSAKIRGCAEPNTGRAYGTIHPSEREMLLIALSFEKLQPNGEEGKRMSRCLPFCPSLAPSICLLHHALPSLSPNSPYIRHDSGMTGIYIWNCRSSVIIPIAKITRSSCFFYRAGSSFTNKKRKRIEVPKHVKTNFNKGFWIGCRTDIRS